MRQWKFFLVYSLRSFLNLDMLTLLIFASWLFHLIVNTKNFLYQLHHETLIWTGIICMEIPCYMHDPSYSCRIVENAKIFWSYAKSVLIPPCVRNCRILIGLCKWVFMNQPIIFFDRKNNVFFFFLFINYFNRYSASVL